MALWLIGIMANRLGLDLADRHDSERLTGFCNRQTDRRTFAILESLLRLKMMTFYFHSIIFTPITVIHRKVIRK